MKESIELGWLSRPVRLAREVAEEGLLKRNFYCRVKPDLDIFVRSAAPIYHQSSGRLWLLHGAGMDSFGFDLPLEGWSLMESLAMRGFEAFAMDFRGHGQSSRVLDGKSVDALTVADDCARVIEIMNQYLVDSPTHLLGESFGSILVPLVAKRLGEPVSSLTLLGPIFGKLGSIEDDFLSSLPEFEASPGGYAFTTEEEWRDLFFGRVDPEVLKWHQLWFGTAYAYPVGPYLSLRGLPVDRELREITAPVLAVMGSLDPFATEGDMKELFDHIGSANKQLLVQEGIGHLPYVEESAAEVLDAICTVLGGDQLQ